MRSSDAVSRWWHAAFGRTGGPGDEGPRLSRADHDDGTRAHTEGTWTLRGQLGWYVATTGAYILAGKLALTMAIPPGYAAAVWPASGIAVVAVLRGGYKQALAVGVGAFIVNVRFDILPLGPIVAASIAVGTALQAAAIRYLIVKFIGYPCSLLRPRDVVRFLLIAGPIACPIAATWGSVTIWLAGLASRGAVAINWATWWVGDSIGVVIFAPMLLAFLGAPVAVWQRRRWRVVPALLVGFVAVTLLFVRMRTWEENHFKAVFERRSELITEAIQRQAERYVDAGVAVASLYRASKTVTPAELASFVARIRERDLGIQGISWVVRVDDVDRSAYELAKRAEYRNFFIWEHGRGGSKVRAISRPVLYPLDEHAPSSTNRGIVGFDLGSEPARRAALEKARDSGQVVATPPLELTRSGQPGLLVLVPVYRTGASIETIAERRRNLIGYATVVIRASDIIATALGGFDRTGIHIELVDAPLVGSPNVLFDDLLQSSTRGGSRATSFPFGDRIWRVQTAPTVASVEAQRPWQSWTVLAGGLLFVSLLGGVLLILTGNESRLLAAEARYRDLYDRSPDLYATMDAKTGVILDCNETAVTALGMDRDDLIGRSTIDLHTSACRESATEALAAFRRVGEVHDVELQLVRRDGTLMDVSLSVTALRDDAGRIVCGRSVWHDVGSRKRAERDLALRLSLSEARRSVEDENALMNQIVTRVGAHLDVDRCFFCDVDLDENTMLVHDDYHRGSESASGTTPLDSYGAACSELLRTGGTLVVDDTSTDPRTRNAYSLGYESAGLRAVLCVPLLHEGRWVASLCATHSTPRSWEPREVALLQSIAERTWLWIEQGRMVHRLRDLNQSLEERIKARTSALELALNERDILLREIHHRVKNNLQVISSLLNLQAHGSADRGLQDALAESCDRIQSLSLVHDQLYRAANVATIEVDQYLRQLVASLEKTHHRPSVSIRVDASPCSLPLDQAVSVGLIVNELITNSLKHAFPGDRRGSVDVSARLDDDASLRLSVRDDGVGLPPGFDVSRGTGLGMIILMTLSQQIGAKLIVSGEPGATFELLVPRAPPTIP